MRGKGGVARRGNRWLPALLAVGVLGCSATGPTPPPGSPPPPPPPPPPAPAIPPAAPVTLFAYDAGAPLAYVESPAGASSAADLFQISFAGGAGSRATGWLAVPREAGLRPAVILLHGAPGTAAAFMSVDGLMLAERGAVVLALDAPFARRGGSTWYFTPGDSLEQVQLIVDLQRAVDVLRARPDVDPARIAFVGGSYGGAMGSLFIGIEHRLAASILFVADGGLVAHYTQRDGTPIGGLDALPAAQRQRWLDAMWPIEGERFIHRRSPAPLLFQNGTFDALVATDDAEALHAAAGPGATVMWYPSGHGLPIQARTDRFTWLAQQIGIRP